MEPARQKEETMQVLHSSWQKFYMCEYGLTTLKLTYMYTGIEQLNG